MFDPFRTAVEDPILQDVAELRRVDQRLKIRLVHSDKNEIGLHSRLQKAGLRPSAGVVLPAGAGAVSEINDVGAAGTHRVLAAFPVAHAAAEMVLKKFVKCG